MLAAPAQWTRTRPQALPFAPGVLLASLMTTQGQPPMQIVLYRATQAIRAPTVAPAQHAALAPSSRQPFLVSVALASAATANTNALCAINTHTSPPPGPPQLASAVQQVPRHFQQARMHWPTACARPGTSLMMEAWTVMPTTMRASPVPRWNSKLLSVRPRAHHAKDPPTRTRPRRCASATMATRVWTAMAVLAKLVLPEPTKT